jgi:RHS repeat-associated protein
VAAFLGAVLVCSSLVVVSAANRAASVAEPPPGGLVPSVANYGWTRGEFGVGDDGAARYTIPLWVSQGRGRSAPELSLSYGSGASNGLLGVGWSLTGLPSITPCTRTRAQDGYVEGLRFNGLDALCLGDNRLLPRSPAGAATREYRTERATFARVIAYGTADGVPDFFRIWAKDGRILTLGETADSRLAAFRLVASDNLQLPVEPESSTRVAVSWAVNRIEDRNGNAATVEYAHHEGDYETVWFAHMRPSVIRYAPNRRVQFAYETRPDPLDGFGGGVHTRIPYRLKRIEMYGGPEGGTAEKLREYRLDYINASITGRSLLNRVSECDSDGACLLSLPFSYSLGGYGVQAIDTSVTDVGTHDSSRHRFFVGDITGDGRDDLLYEDANENWKVRHSTGSGFGAAIGANIPGVPALDGHAEIRTVDFDADGRMDVLAEVGDTSEGGTGWHLYRSNGLTFSPVFDGDGIVLGSSSGPNDDDLDPIYFADLDGNALPDFVRAPYDFRQGDDLDEATRIDGPWSYRLNNGPLGANRFAAPVAANESGPNQSIANNVLDTDGDGRVELAGRRRSGEESQTRSLGLGATGTAEAMTVAVGGTFSCSPQSCLTTLGDFNGDGLVDSVNTDGGFNGLHAKLNVGNNAAYRLVGQHTAYAPPRRYEGPVGGGFFDRGVRVGDFNNDGRHDVLIFRGGTPTGPNDVSNGLQVYVWSDPDTFRQAGFTHATSLAAGGWDADDGLAWSQVLDIDGNDVLDVVHVHNGHLRILRRTDGAPDRLVAAGVSSWRDRVEIEYGTLADRAHHTPATCPSAYPVSCPARGGTIVIRHRIANLVGTGDASWDRYEHTYESARMDLHGRGWLGFAEHRVKRLATGEVTVTELDNLARDPATKAYPFAHLPRRITYMVSEGTGGREFRRTVTNSYAMRPLAYGYTVEPRTVTEIDEERAVGTTTWQVLRTHTTQTTFDGFGNRDLVVSTTSGGRRVTEDATYRNDETAWLIGLPTREVATSCTPASVCVTRETTSDYDGNGNPIQKVVEPNQPALRLSTVTGYGEFGVVESVTQADDAGPARTTTFRYDNADKLYPTSTVNALGHETVVETHSGLGVPLRTVDPNGVPTTMRYDRFGRLREVNRADGSFERIDHVFFTWQFAITTVSGGGSSMVVADQLGRQRELHVKTFDGRTAITRTNYDVLGRVQRVSRPILPGETPQYTTYTYDKRNRPTSVTAPDGAVIRHEYVNRETHSYDAKGAHTYTVVSVNGDLESSFEPNPAGGWLHTRFEYGPFGTTTRVVAPDGTAQVMEHDRLGRRERLVDPSSGTTVTTYNAFDEVLTQTDGTGARATYTHDALGRVTRINSPDGRTTYTWDTAANGKGRLASSDSPDDVFTRYGYDAVGHHTMTSWRVAGGDVFQINTGYDEIGRPASTTYPAIPGATGRLRIDYAYNQHGYLEQVRDAAAGGPVYWTALGRDGAGQLTRARQGDETTGVVTDYAYNTVGQLREITATGPGGQLGHIAYGYDLNRNVTVRHDTVNKRYEQYAYDPLNRLTRWHTPAPGQGYQVIEATYRYDRMGNLETETFQRQGEPATSTTYGHGEGGAPPHALTSRNGAAPYGYDAAGRQITGPRRTVAYNRRGLPRVLTWGQGKQIEYAYDADGSRARKRDTEQTVIYAGGLFQRYTPAGAGGAQIHNVHNIVVDGRVVAQVNRVQAATGGPVTATRVTFLHADLQGSTTMVTNSAGEPVGDGDGFLAHQFYDPFGRRVDAAYEPVRHIRHGAPRWGYTGHEMDDEVGLVNAGGRIYDPDDRRFLTPDPVIADSSFSQDLNRYAYVRNNPATLTDPTGLIASDGRGVYTLFGAGPSSIGMAWMDNSAFFAATLTPFNAPLTTHVVNAIHHVFSGGSDDDEGKKGSGDSTEDSPPVAQGTVLTPNDATDLEVHYDGTITWRDADGYKVWYPDEAEPAIVRRAVWTLVRMGWRFQGNFRAEVQFGTTQDSELGFEGTAEFYPFGKSVSVDYTPLGKGAGSAGAGVSVNGGKIEAAAGCGGGSCGASVGLWGPTVGFHLGSCIPFMVCYKIEGGLGPVLGAKAEVGTGGAKGGVGVGFAEIEGSVSPPEIDTQAAGFYFWELVKSGRFF